MGQSLRTRLFLASAIVVLVALGAATWLLAREQRRWLLDRHAESLARAAGALVRELAAGSAEESTDWSGTSVCQGRSSKNRRISPTWREPSYASALRQC